MVDFFSKFYFFFNTVDIFILDFAAHKIAHNLTKEKICSGKGEGLKREREKRREKSIANK